MSHSVSPRWTTWIKGDGVGKGEVVGLGLAVGGLVAGGLVAGTLLGCGVAVGGGGVAVSVVAVGLTAAMSVGVAVGAGAPDMIAVSKRAAAVPSSARPTSHVTIRAAQPMAPPALGLGPALLAGACAGDAAAGKIAAPGIGRVAA